MNKTTHNTSVNPQDVNIEVEVHVTVVNYIRVLNMHHHLSARSEKSRESDSSKSEMLAAELLLTDLVTGLALLSAEKKGMA